MTGGDLVRRAICCNALLASVLMVATATATAAAQAQAQADGDAVRIVVLKEHGVGSQTLAQPFLNKFVAIAGEQNNWTAPQGQYFASRDAAIAFIESAKP